jgi:nucleotide-binding universal stress UspA family protein
MGFKTILVHVDTGPSAPARLKLTAELAARFEAHIAGVYVRRPFQAPAFTDAGLAMDSLYRTYENAAKADEALATAAFRDSIGSQIIGGRGLSSEWRVAEGLAEEVVAAYARYADLAIIGQAEPDAMATTTPPDLAETIAMAGERPVLIVPHIGVTKPPGKTVMLCWNGSREAARAATGALPFLKAADKTIILLVDPRKDGAEQSGARVAGWLARHGVKAVVQRDTAADSNVGGVILSRAADHDADLIVMGLYGHSRMREWVLGGASRTLLASMTVPLLVAH